MLPIYLDIVDEAKRAINKNIWYMFELLESNCAALPENWTYPLIQPKLIEKYLKMEKAL